MMTTNNKLYRKICSFDNLVLAWRKARKGKTKKSYVIEFEKDTENNLLYLQEELRREIYKPKPLKEFIIRDPKTRRIAKSEFADRIVYHGIVNVLEPIYENLFIFDNCANRKGKGTLFALNRFEKFQRKVTNNFTSGAYCLKADVKHYFQEVNHKILIEIISKKIKDEKVIWLIKQILQNTAELEINAEFF